MSDFKELVESLSDPEIRRSDYYEALKLIAEEVDRIWRYICSASGRNLDWWAFRNDRSLGHGNGSTGGEFDPVEDAEFIEIIGHNCRIDDDFYEYDEGFPTELLWSDWKSVVDAHIAKWKKPKKSKPPSKRQLKVEMLEKLKSKLLPLLSLEEKEFLKTKLRW